LNKIVSISICVKFYLSPAKPLETGGNRMRAGRARGYPRGFLAEDAPPLGLGQPADRLKFAVARLPADQAFVQKVRML
jgi:hypothetical protein